MMPNRIADHGYPVSSREEYFDFLVRCYFGKDDDRLSLCVRRAYLDMNRTLHGLRRSIKAPDDLRQRACRHVVELLKDLPKNKINSAGAFDSWHESACIQLKSLYRDNGFGFSIGQAQKWLNMSMKYIFTLGEDRLPGYGPLYQFAHIPIDNVVLNEVKKLRGPSLSERWSRLDNYRTYFEYQQKCRNLFVGSSPLAAEFRLWQGSRNSTHCVEPG